MLVRNPARHNGAAGRSHYSLGGIGKLEEHLERLGSTQTAPPGDDQVRVGQIDLVRLGNKLEDLGINLLLAETELFCDDLAGAFRVREGGWEYPRTAGGHLRAMA